MPILALIGRWLDRGFTSACGVVGAGAGSQTSALVDAYRQNLAGRVDELARIVEGFQSRADQAGLTLTAYVAEFTGNESDIIRWEGNAMADTIARHRAMEGQLSTLAEATPLTEPLVALRGLDTAIAADVIAAFTPALPLDATALTYTVVGAVVLIALFQMLALPVRAGAAAGRSPSRSSTAK